MLVLSIFPGLDVLGHAFEAEGFTVVRGPDVILGGDIRRFHPPTGRFDGVIGGDPCQSHSSLANLVRAKGLEPRFPDMTGEYQRIIEEVRPSWFLRENVPRAPDVKPAGYDVRTFLLDNWSSLGEEQQRRRRFWFGTRDVPCPELRRWIDFALEIPGEAALAVNAGHDHLDFRPRPSVCGDARAVPVAIGGGGKVKRTAVQGGHDATLGNRITAQRRSPVTGRYEGAVGAPGKDYSARYTLAEMIELQGLPADYLNHTPFTVQGLRKMIGNAVPVPMGRALARAVRKAMEATHAA